MTCLRGSLPKGAARVTECNEEGCSYKRLSPAARQGLSVFELSTERDCLDFRSKQNLKGITMGNHWTDSIDLVVTEKTTFRPVGWLINGGPNDGLMVNEVTEEHKSAGLDSFSPLYIQISPLYIQISN